MHRILPLILALVCLLQVPAQDLAQENSTPTWEETIAFYKKLATRHRLTRLVEIGNDDNGRPLHMFIISDGSDFTPESIRADGKSILLINNAIHPGEPCGVNASMRLARDLVENDQLMSLTSNTAVCIIPMYNVSGAERRGCCSRANQVGPEEYGFRGNARNLDLNRDFIKMDSRNAFALTKVLREWDPDVFIDTHTTNGSDHQYAMQLLAAQDDRLDPALRSFMNNEFQPALYEWMNKKGINMCPYFWPKKDVPDNGLLGFDDSPRYSSGYTTLFNMFGFVSEAHMLKPFADRVEATYQLQLAILDVMHRKQAALLAARERAKANTASRKQFTFGYEMDRDDSLLIPFKAVKYTYQTSGVTGQERYVYFPEDPIDIEVAYFDRFIPTVEVGRPAGYLIPQAWRHVIERLKWNNVYMEELRQDTSIMVSAYRIGDLQTLEQPYEGHYLHSNVQVEVERMGVQFMKGDIWIPLGYDTDRFVVETLEPHAEDSYFAWGFFDSVLQQKEWFSPYVFEEKAMKLLKERAGLKKTFEEKKASDAEFAASGWAQLYWLYKQSPYYERTVNLYPVYRVEVK